jgi:hypothetical protein
MTVAELLARVSSQEIGEWVEYYRRRDVEFLDAHPELKTPARTTPSGRPVNTRGT